MQSFKKGLFGPVGFIVLFQVLVLLGSLLVASNIVSPFVFNDNQDRFSSLTSEEFVRSDSIPSIFPLKEVMASDYGEDFFTRDPSASELEDQEFQYTVARGDQLSSIWLKNGSSAIGATRAQEAFKAAGIKNFSITKGELLNIRVSSQGDITKLSKRNKDGSTVVLSGSSIDGYEVLVVKPNIIEAERSVSGAIFGSFFSAAQSQGVSLETIDSVVDLFGSRIEFSRAIQPGDSYTITFTEKRCQETGEVLDVGPVVSASFRNKGKLFAAIRYKDSSGKFVYFDEKGQMGGDFFLRYPVKFSRISSTFSWARFHPILKTNRPHKGVDFAAPVGTPIRSVGDGVIEFAGYKAAPGNMIKIKHSGRWTTVYMHMQKLAPGMKQGKAISRGDVIGYLGSTGLSTGPHLHFELWDNGKYIDPLKADLPSIAPESTGLPKGYLTAALKDFEQKHAQVQVALLDKDNKRKA
jgi:murein DD-endopeptidase MepM/ murein hydrolase activator NlpD